MRTLSLPVLLVFLCASSTASADALIWFRHDQLTPQAIDVVKVMQDAAAFGLDPSDYTLPITNDEWQRLRLRSTEAERSAIDRSLSKIVTRFVAHLSRGRIDGRAVGFNLPAAVAASDPEAAMLDIATASDVSAAIALHEPRPRPYRMLKAALARYRALAREETLPPLATSSKSVKPGDSYADAAALRARLIALGDLSPTSTTAETTLDPVLSEGVARFQARHGLQADGVLGKRTFAALATPLSDRVTQIELTLERWRWANGLARPDIIVNIPQFMLFALPASGRDVDPMLEMPVIVGQSYSHTRTPIFTAAIRYVVFQPYWDVPSSILHRELLPLIRKDPTYLERHHMEMVRGQGDNSPVVEPSPEAIEQLAAGALRLRQRPGPQNSLGQVKFMLPNPYNVYLHATPSVELFNKARRAFSHGCIRVSQPAALAEYVLKNAAPPWSAEQIEAAMCASKMQRVDLQTPVNVLIFYGTAVATAEHGVMFFEDLYGYDRKLQQALAVRHARAQRTAQ